MEVLPDGLQYLVEVFNQTLLEVIGVDHPFFIILFKLLKAVVNLFLTKLLDKNLDGLVVAENEVLEVLDAGVVNCDFLGAEGPPYFFLNFFGAVFYKNCVFRVRL